MTERTFSIHDNLVTETFPDGAVSYDIFDGNDWPGGDEEGKQYARLIHRCLNRHSAMLHATLELCAALELACSRTGTDWIGSGVHNAIDHVRKTILEEGMTTLSGVVKKLEESPYDD